MRDTGGNCRWLGARLKRAARFLIDAGSAGNCGRWWVRRRADLLALATVWLLMRAAFGGEWAWFAIAVLVTSQLIYRLEQHVFGSHVGRLYPYAVAGLVVSYGVIAGVWYFLVAGCTGHPISTVTIVCTLGGWVVLGLIMLYHRWYILRSATGADHSVL